MLKGSHISPANSSKNKAEARKKKDRRKKRRANWRKLFENQPLRLEDLENQEIRDMLLTEKNSCQYIKIAKTPTEEPLRSYPKPRLRKNDVVQAQVDNETKAHE